MRATGGWADRGCSSKWDARFGLDGYRRSRCGCRTLVLHSGGLMLKCQPTQAHGPSEAVGYHVVCTHYRRIGRGVRASFSILWIRWNNVDANERTWA
jgi:hypothetical protein